MIVSSPWVSMSVAGPPLVSAAANSIVSAPPTRLVAKIASRNEVTPSLKSTVSSSVLDGHHGQQPAVLERLDPQPPRSDMAWSCRWRALERDVNPLEKKTTGVAYFEPFCCPLFTNCGETCSLHGSDRVQATDRADQFPFENRRSAVQ